MGTHPIFESDFDCLTELEIMGGHAWHTSTDDGGNQYKWFLENYKPPTSYPKDAINAILNNNNAPDFRSYGNPQGADFWNIWGKAGLVKREPVVSRQQRRLAKMNSFYSREFPNSCQMEAFAMEKCYRDFVTQKGAQYGMFQAMTGEACSGTVTRFDDCLDNEQLIGMALQERVRRIQKHMGAKPYWPNGWC